jgi:hypothetical protein
VFHPSESKDTIFCGLNALFVFLNFFIRPKTGQLRRFLLNFVVKLPAVEWEIPRLPGVFGIFKSGK